MFAVLLLMVPIFASWRERNSYLHGIAFSLFLLVEGACLLVGNATWLELICFRCPRCREHFVAPFGFAFLPNTCRHCRLNLGRAVIDKAKPLQNADLLE